MQAYFAFFITLVAACAITALFLVYYSWARRDRTPYANLFMWFMVIVCIWTISSTISFFTNTPEAAYFWSVRMRYIGIALLPVPMLIFSISYGSNQQWITPPKLGALLIVPALTIGIIWSPFTSLFLADFVFERVGPFTVRVSNTNGPWFFVHTVYSYILSVTAIAFLMRRAIRSNYPYRGQAILLLAGAILPLLANILTVAAVIEPIPPDFTAVSFTVTAVVWAFALFRYRLLDIAPIARNLVVESMNDAVIVLDANNRIVDVNPMARSLIASATSNPLGLAVEEAFPNQKTLIEEIQKADRTNRETVVEVGSQERVFDIRYDLLFGQSKRSIGYLVVLRDITERKRTEEERERLIGELNAYAHTVAHDLKNPLGVVFSSANYLRDFQDNLSPEKKEEYLERIVRTTDKMVSIVDELLLLASVREQQDLSLMPVDMGRIVKDVIRRLEHDIQRTEAQVDVQAKMPRVTSYAPWVEEVWVNYVSNALKYGGTPPTVSIGADDKKGSDTVRFWVRDNGQGIPAEKAEKLFANFERLETVLSDGHGLGLSIVKRIVTRLGGEVGVESTPGEGSTFYFTLPVYLVESSRSK